MRLAFPTDHLSTAFADRPGSIKWIDPAPPEMALGIELYLIRDTEYEIRKAFAKEKQRTLLALGPLRGGVNLLVRSTHFECGPVEVHLPGNPPAPGKVFGDLVFPEIDTEGTGRPVRMLLPMPRGNPPVFWELGGYEARPLEAFGRE